MAKKPDTRSVPRSNAHGAATKAAEFLATAESAVNESRWNAAGLAAVHAGISAADSVLAAAAGLRSVSQDHGYVIRLLETTVHDFPAAQRRHISGLIFMKSTVAYDCRLLTETEARQLLDHARRFTRWAQGVVENGA